MPDLEDDEPNENNEKDEEDSNDEEEQINHNTKTEAPKNRDTKIKHEGIISLFIYIIYNIEEK